jgi:type II secretory pathway pseudopilin PulG
MIMRFQFSQRGATLIELMIGLALSLIVTSSMVALMGNSMGSATRIIQMTQLTDELRNSMSMLSRDVRRANYSSMAVRCYANPDCGTDGSTVHENIVFGGDQCVIFNVDRDQDNFNHPGVAPGAIAFVDSDFQSGGFRRVQDVDEIGVIEMWVGDGSADCGDDVLQPDDDWLELTDRNYVDIVDFSVVPNTIETSILDEDGNGISQSTNAIKVVMEGALRIDDQITRRIEDTVKVRNDFIEKVVAPAP